MNGNVMEILEKEEILKELTSAYFVSKQE